MIDPESNRCTVFVTFKNQFAAKLFRNTKSFYMFGIQTTILEQISASDIFWENLIFEKDNEVNAFESFIIKHLKNSKGCISSIKQQKIIPFQAFQILFSSILQIWVFPYFQFSLFTVSLIL